MRSRFVSNLCVLVLAAVLVTLSLTFRPAVVGWLALGLGCAMTVVTLIGFAFGGRGMVQRVLDVLILAIGVWTIVSARAFFGDAVRWLSFSNAVALWALAVLGLIVHEVSVERDVAVLERTSGQDGHRWMAFPAAVAHRERLGAR